MKLRSYGIVLVTLLAGAFSLPTNIGLSKDVDVQGTFLETKDANMQENESKVTSMSKKETPEMEDALSISVKYPQNTEKGGFSEENEMEITPRVLESDQYHDKNSKETEIKQDTLTNNEIESVKKKKETKEETGKSLDSTQSVGLKCNTPESSPKEVMASVQAINSEGMSKPTNAWNDFEDGKYSLLEDRLPDLTDEEFREINKEGSIPLNFLKHSDASITTNEIKGGLVKPGGLGKDKSSAETKLETPVYITIPIVINSNSNLPISLSIGGQTVAINEVNKMAHMVTPQIKILDNASIPPRETNRQQQYSP